MGTGDVDANWCSGEMWREKVAETEPAEEKALAHRHLLITLVTWALLATAVAPCPPISP